MAISFKKLAQAAALKAVNDLSDAPLTGDAVATVEAKGLEALEALKAIEATARKEYLATPEGVRKALLAKRAAQARLMASACLASITGRTDTVQARRGQDIKEGKGESRKSLTPQQVCKDLTDLLAQPGMLKHDLGTYDPANKGAKPAPAPLLALRTLEQTLRTKAIVQTAQAAAMTSQKAQAAKAA